MLDRGASTSEVQGRGAGTPGLWVGVGQGCERRGSPDWPGLCGGSGGPSGACGYWGRGERGSEGGGVVNARVIDTNAHSMALDKWLLWGEMAAVGRTPTFSCPGRRQAWWVT